MWRKTIIAAAGRRSGQSPANFNDRRPAADWGGGDCTPHGKPWGYRSRNRLPAAPSSRRGGSAREGACRPQLTRALIYPAFDDITGVGTRPRVPGARQRSRRGGSAREGACRPQLICRARDFYKTYKSYKIYKSPAIEKAGGRGASCFLWGWMCGLVLDFAVEFEFGEVPVVGGRGRAEVLALVVLDHAEAEIFELFGGSIHLVDLTDFE